MSEVRRVEEMLAEAAAKGCIVVYPEPDELFIDIDFPAALEVFRFQLAIFRQLHPVAEVKQTPSLTAGHFHVVVKLASPVPKPVAETRIF